MGLALWFTQAKQALRNHPDWTDEQVAEAIGLPKMQIPAVLPEARKDLKADSNDPEPLVR